MKKPKIMSDREYVKRGGVDCPFCGSGDIESIEGLQVDGTNCWQEIECLRCHRTWRDVYRLVGYEGTEEQACHKEIEGEPTDEDRSYLVFVYGDIDPEILGPFNDENERDKKALELRREHGDEHGIFMLYVAGNGDPTIDAYSGAFFEEVSEE